MGTQLPDDADGIGAADNRVGTYGSVGDVIQARDVHGGVHLHRAADAFSVVPRQLPRHVRGFVNRRSELARLAEVLATHDDSPGVIVITGTAGVGKTSLALRWAHALQQRFPDGQLYVNLRGYDPDPPVGPEEVLGRFLRAFGVPSRAVPRDMDDRSALYRSIVANKQVLVLLDNAATTRQVRPLLPGAPLSLVVVTSRSRLSGLIAREGAARLQVDLLDDDSAVSLLRAATSSQRRGDEPADLVELARLCARLPLALRIAAERAASRPLEPLTALMADLRDESGLWEALTPEADDEADAVRAVFAWSYRALPSRTAAVFRLVGLHPGDEFGVPAAAALAGADIVRTRQDLDALVGAQLLEHSAPRRYRFHDLLRAYAIDQGRSLEEAGAGEKAVRRMVSWYLHTADEAQRLIAPHDRFVLPGPPPPDTAPLSFTDYDAALLWYRTEASNLVATVRLAARLGLHDQVWQMAAVLRAVYMHQNAFDDWLTVAELGAVSAVEAGDVAAEAEAQDTLGKLHFQAMRLDRAEQHHLRALALRRQLGDRVGEMVSVNALGLLGLRHRRLDAARADFALAADIATELRDERWEALARSNLAEALTDGGEYESASDLLGQLLETFRRLKDRAGEGNALNTLSRALRQAGRIAEARTAIDAALEIAVVDDNQVWRAHWLTELGHVQLAEDRAPDSLEAFQQAAVIHRQLGDRSREALAIDGSGRAYQALERREEAVGFHRIAASVHRGLGDRWNLANALAHLVIALTDLGRLEEADQARLEAANALAQFDDPVAIELRDRLIRTS
ncbi:tetratricopeptide repeat protein [Saccharothrix sp. NPDC042600]|uniref:ATP-binding protein n=1 Tax=Saccharothrix TaxID=2071 RepID=UPI0033D40CB0|nr:tetratricopeptide repeat protein [Saccharothrix mutabilis subsp. capreolus]